MLQELWRNVAYCPRKACCGAGRDHDLGAPLHRAGHIKIADHRRAVFADENILRLDVAVDHSARMEEVQAFQKHNDHAVDLQNVALLLGMHPLPQRTLRVVRHLNVRRLVGEEGAVDLRDGVMAAPRENARFPDKVALALVIFEHMHELLEHDLGSSARRRGPLRC